ncbi:hypothetical protein LXL04_018986 [Taraxacum kok-saghyz]
MSSVEPIVTRYAVRYGERDTVWVAVSKDREPKSEFQESASKSKLNRFFPNRNRDSMESLINRIRNATGNDSSRVWDRLLKSVFFTYRRDFAAIGNTAIGNVDRGCLGESGIYGRTIRTIVCFSF